MQNKIKDTDTHFIIDGSTRLVKNEQEVKSMLVQYDNNSERFTFRVPRTVDGHDLSECHDDTRIHYINIDKNKKKENHGNDPITDVMVCPEDDKFVQCSWLVPRNATQLAGSLHFVIEFALKDDEGNNIYSWNTAKYTGITIQDGINYEESFVADNNDLLIQWENRLLANQIVKMEQTKSSTADSGVNEWTATFGDGRKTTFNVRNGSRGATGYVGSIETIDGKPLKFFVGTKAQYDALTDSQKVNLFAIITDDTSKEGIESAIRQLSTNYDALLNGNSVVEQARTAYMLNPSKIAQRMYGGTMEVVLDNGSLYALFVGGCSYMLYVDTEQEYCTSSADVNGQYFTYRASEIKLKYFASKGVASTGDYTIKRIKIM